MGTSNLSGSRVLESLPELGWWNGSGRGSFQCIFSVLTG